MSLIYYTLVWFIAVVLFLFFAYMLISMDSFSPNLEHFIEINKERCGVEHDITAVLLSFRGLDTLLEVGVIFLALVAIDVLRPHFRYRPYVYRSDLTDVYGAILIPLIALSSFYILSAGTYTSGGAFVAAALLAGGMILLKLTQPNTFNKIKEKHLRLFYASGLFIFTAIGFYGIYHGAFLAYPKNSAYYFIFFIETALTLSLAAILGAFFIGSIQRFK